MAGRKPPATARHGCRRFPANRVVGNHNYVLSGLPSRCRDVCRSLRTMSEPWSRRSSPSRARENFHVCFQWQPINANSSLQCVVMHPCVPEKILFTTISHQESALKQSVVKKSLNSTRCDGDATHLKLATRGHLTNSRCDCEAGLRVRRRPSDVETTTPRRATQSNHDCAALHHPRRACRATMLARRRVFSAAASDGAAGISAPLPGW